MREIKFRAWDKQCKEMHYNFQWIDNGNNGNDWIIFKSNRQKLSNKPHPFENPYFRQQYKIMQYTGLKDKNGKEIYEGDIVHIWHEDYPEEKSVGKVAYNLGGGYPAFDIYVFTGRGNLKYESYHDEYNSFSCPDHIIELIGNIHESSELLEAKK